MMNVLVTSGAAVHGWSPKLPDKEKRYDNFETPLRDIA